MKRSGRTRKTTIRLTEHNQCDIMYIVMRDIEKQLRNAAVRSGRSIKSMADEAGLCYQTLHGYLKHDRQITLLSAAKLARVLGLELRQVKRKRKGGA